MGQITVSVVSHGHGALLPGLLEDLEACPEVGQIIITKNIPEPELCHSAAKTPLIIENTSPKGFGQNHNAAFKQARFPFFAVVNPDIRLEGNPFPALIDSLKAENIAIAAPLVINPTGAMEDSARRFPTLGNLTLKALRIDDGRLSYKRDDPPSVAPWVAGMFMLFRSSDYMALHGFDEGYFLYYEDVDICARTWKLGKKVMLCPSTAVVHDAQRASHRNFQHMKWHLASMARYLRKYYTNSYPRNIG